MDAAKYMCSSKHLKRKKITIALQNYTKISFKRLYNNLSYFFSRNFLQHFSSRPYPNDK